jgi:hypothetical protein
LPAFGAVVGRQITYRGLVGPIEHLNLKLLRVQQAAERFFPESPVASVAWVREAVNQYLPSRSLLARQKRLYGSSCQRLDDLKVVQKRRCHVARFAFLPVSL